MTPDEPTDEALAERARSGDRRAFERLVTRFKAPLYRFIGRYVGGSDDAYDVLQDTFISAWGGLKRYDPARPFAPWLRTIALNRCRDFGRRQATRRILHELFAREPREVSRDPAPASSTWEEERAARLDAAIAGLPAKYKEPLLLTTVEGLSHQDTAALLHLTPKAVEMRLYRARRILTEQLGRETAA